MRTGDPKTAKSGKTWIGEHKPFSSPVQRSVAGLNTPEPSHVAQASNQGTAAAVDNAQALHGDFKNASGARAVNGIRQG